MAKRRQTFWTRRIEPGPNVVLAPIPETARPPPRAVEPVAPQREIQVLFW
jgi:hypothetical protein